MRVIRAEKLPIRILLAVDVGVLADGDGRGVDLWHVDKHAERVGLHQVEQGPRLAGVVRRDQRARIHGARRDDAGEGGDDLLERLQVRILLDGRLIDLDAGPGRFDLGGGRLDLGPVLVDRQLRDGAGTAAVGVEVPFERDLCQLEVRLGHLQIALGQDEVGPGLGELVVHVGRADLGQQLTLLRPGRRCPPASG